MSATIRAVQVGDRLTLVMAGDLASAAGRELLAERCAHVRATEGPRALVVDLTDVDAVGTESLDVLEDLLDVWSARERPSVVVCREGPIDRQLDAGGFAGRQRVLTRSSSPG